jgi:hypothetical protein
MYLRARLNTPLQTALHKWFPWHKQKQLLSLSLSLFLLFPLSLFFFLPYPPSLPLFLFLFISLYLSSISLPPSPSLLPFAVNPSQQNHDHSLYSDMWPTKRLASTLTKLSMSKGNQDKAKPKATTWACATEGDTLV